MRRDARVQSLNLHLGGRQARHESLSQLQAPGAFSVMLALTVAHDAQEFDQPVVVDALDRRQAEILRRQHVAEFFRADAFEHDRGAPRDLVYRHEIALEHLLASVVLLLVLGEGAARFQGIEPGLLQAGEATVLEVLLARRSLAAIRGRAARARAALSFARYKLWLYFQQLGVTDATAGSRSPSEGPDERR